MPWLANLIYLLGGLLYLPILAYQMAFQGKNRRGWLQRFGHGNIPPTSQPRIWIHAVSLGEINATPLLVQKLRQALPTHSIVISTTTDTGYARACQLFGSESVFRFPLDFSWVMNRVLKRLNPSLIVLVELEVWYNLLRTATRRGIPVAVVNGRLTEKSHRRFNLVKPCIKPMFANLAWVGAQDDAIAQRFVELGVPANRVEVAGSLKWDSTTVADDIDGAKALSTALELSPDTPLWVCGSTGPDEEKLLLDAYRQLADQGRKVTLALVPRKPERFNQVADLIDSRGYTCTRRSERPDGTLADSNVPHNDTNQSIILGDTMGELRKFYSLAQVVFVGRSLVPMGGSDPMEVAALAKPILAGPHMNNFALPVQALAQAGALHQVRDVAELVTTMGTLLDNPDAARQQGRQARQVVLNNQGATDHTVKQLVALLKSA